MATNASEYDAEREDIWSTVCPIGNPQRERACCAYREPDAGRLQLRVPLRISEGVCEVILDEHPDKVEVRVLVCYDEGADEHGPSESTNCPVHAYLEAPLNGRPVIDHQTGKELPLYVPEH